MWKEPGPVSSGRTSEPKDEGVASRTEVPNLLSDQAIPLSEIVNPWRIGMADMTTREEWLVSSVWKFQWKKRSKKSQEARRRCR